MYVMISIYHTTARVNMTMQSEMEIWSTFTTAVQLREVHHLCALDVHYVVVKVKIIQQFKAIFINNFHSFYQQMEAVLQ